MAHNHTHNHDLSNIGEKRLWWAISANFILTFAQVLGGVISGSLSLVADALHNLSDAVSLVIAVIAIRIGRKPADDLKTFGYKRAETIAALINFTALITIGIYLCYEAIDRFISPQPITGLIVIYVASIALIVDLFTVMLTYKHSKNSMNIRVAFIHNISDALGSVAVIIAGIMVVTKNWLWVDPAMTLLIASYVLYHGISEIPNAIHLLMEGTPKDIDLEQVIKTIKTIQGVSGTHHLHVWQLDEHRNALEAHIVISDKVFTKENSMDHIRNNLKKVLHDKYAIEHATLEFEQNNCSDDQPLH